MELYQKPIHVLHEERLNGTVTTVDIVRSVVTRRDETDDVIGAYLYKIPMSELIEAAEKVDQKIKAGDSVNPLEGMPIGIKDVFNTKGHPSTAASKILDGYISPYESTVTQNLLDHGCLFTGKINMDEFAMGSSNENSGKGIVRNPWDTDRVPGGSSGGSSAAVATGSALAAMGSDTGGSIRLPAAYTSTVGLKPTYGMASRYGMISYASSLDQASVIAKDTQDAAMMCDAFTGYDPRDSTSLNCPKPDLLGNLNKDVKGLKVGIIDNLDLTACEDEIRENFEKSVESFKKAGAEIQKVNIDNLSHAIASYYIIATAEASSNLGRYDGIRYGMRHNSDKLSEIYRMTRDNGFGDEVKLRILIGTFALSSGYYDAYYLKAKRIQQAVKSSFEKALNQVDIILSPVSTGVPFKIGENTDDPIKMYMNDVFTITANMACIPGLSVPSGFSKENLPIGLQILAGRLKEGNLIRASHWFEKQLALNPPAMAI